jgi:hypothetical protein
MFKKAAIVPLLVLNLRLVSGLNEDRRPLYVLRFVDRYYNISCFQRGFSLQFGHRRKCY